jgi:hypothetical protein
VPTHDRELRALLRRYLRPPGVDLEAPDTPPLAGLVTLSGRGG